VKRVSRVLIDNASQFHREPIVLLPNRFFVMIQHNRLKRKIQFNLSLPFAIIDRLSFLS
jgi:hypothetical protein